MGLKERIDDIFNRFNEYNKETKEIIGDGNINDQKVIKLMLKTAIFSFQVFMIIIILLTIVHVYIKTFK